MRTDPPLTPARRILRLALPLALLLPLLISPDSAHAQAQERIPLTGHAIINNSYYVFLKNPLSGNPVMLSQTPDALNNQLITFNGHQGLIRLGGQELPIQAGVVAPQPPSQETPPLGRYDADCDCDYCHDPSADPPLNPTWLEDLKTGKKKAFEDKAHALQAQSQNQYILIAIVPLPPDGYTRTSDPDIHQTFDLMWNIPAQIQLLDKNSGKTLTLEDNGHWTDLTQKQLPPNNPDQLLIQHRLILPLLSENKILLKKGNLTLIVEPETLP